MAAPDVYSGINRSVVLEGTEIGDWLSDFEFDAEDDVQEFQGSNGTPKARVPAGTTYGLTFTVANHPTPMGVLETLYYTSPKPTGTMVVTYYAGRVKTYTLQITHLTESGGSGDVLTVDVEAVVSAVE